MELGKRPEVMDKTKQSAFSKQISREFKKRPTDSNRLELARMVKWDRCPVMYTIMVEGIDWGPEVPLVVRKYALQNSIEYGGDGQEGSVLGRVLSEIQRIRC